MMSLSAVGSVFPWLLKIVQPADSWLIGAFGAVLLLGIGVELARSLCQATEPRRSSSRATARRRIAAVTSVLFLFALPSIPIGPLAGIAALSLGISLALGRCLSYVTRNQRWHRSFTLPVAGFGLVLAATAMMAGGGLTQFQPSTVAAAGGGTTGVSVTAIAGGFFHATMLDANGTAWGDGDNQYGGLGDGTLTDRAAPTPMMRDVTVLGAGGTHTLVAKTDGTVWDWGENAQGALGNGTTATNDCLCSPTPVQVSGLSDVVALTSTLSGSVALKSDGTVWAWGVDLTDGIGPIMPGQESTTPVQVSGLSGVVAIAAGYEHMLALKSNGTVWAWGDNSSGQQGIGSTETDAPQFYPEQVIGLSDVVAIAAGESHSLAVESDGSVWIWGDARGDGTFVGPFGDGGDFALVPEQVSGISDAVAAATGWGHVLILNSDGTVWAWGSNEYGQLGDGTTTDQIAPVEVQG
jgi:alpha-tubulin suppressor-like RCC1 family protein